MSILAEISRIFHPIYRPSCIIFLPCVNVFVSGLCCNFMAILSALLLMVFLSSEHISLLVPRTLALFGNCVFLELK